MARNTRRRAAQERNKKVIDFLNGVAEDKADADDAHSTNIQPHIDTESVDHDHGDGQRQTRRSARLNQTARDVTPVPKNNIPEPPESPLFVEQNPGYDPEAEAEDAADEEINEAEEADEEINEAEEADEVEDERGVDDDGDSVESVESEEDASMSDHEQQLLQEQEQAIANSQQEQQHELEQALASSPVSVVIINRKERGRDKDVSSTKPAETKSARAAAGHINLFAEDDELEDSESEQDDQITDKDEPAQDENDEEPAQDDDFDLNDSRHDVGTTLQDMLDESLFDWDGQRSVESDEPADPTESAQRARIVETQFPQPSGPSSRKRRRASDDSTGMHDRTRRRRESPNQSIESAPRRRPPVARDSPEVAEWEAIILEDGPQDEVIVVAERITFDDATKVQDLQVTWRRLMEYCQKVKDNDARRMHRYVGIEAIVERIADLLKDYKRMQRKRSRGRAIDPATWQRTRQEVKYISEDAKKIRNVLQRRAKEGKASDDLQAQADAQEYAILIWQQVITNLSELALECLKTYYSEEDEWLLTGGFEAVMDILDIAGELNTALTSLHRCELIFLSPDPGRHIRLELRSISQSLADAEVYKHKRRR